MFKFLAAVFKTKQAA